MSFDVGAPYNLLYCVSFLICCSAAVPVIIFMISGIKDLLKKQRSTISHKTYMMHKELLKTLIFQMMIPLFILTIPSVAFIVLIACNIETTPYLFQVIWISVSCHSTMNTVMMVYFIKPYRYRFIYNFWQVPGEFLSRIYKTDESTLSNNHISFTDR